MKVLKDCSFFSVIFIRPQTFCCDGIVLWVCRHQSVDKMVSYLIVGAMVSMLTLSVVDPWVRTPVWSNERQSNWYWLFLC